MRLRNPERGAFVGPALKFFSKLGLQVKKVLMHIRFCVPGKALLIDCSTKDPLTRDAGSCQTFISNCPVLMPDRSNRKARWEEPEGLCDAYRTLLIRWLFLIYAQKRRDIRILHKVQSDYCTYLLKALFAAML